MVCLPPPVGREAVCDREHVPAPSLTALHQPTTDASYVGAVLLVLAALSGLKVGMTGKPQLIMIKSKFLQAGYSPAGFIGTKNINLLT